MRIYIRPARRSDREPVLKFTERTWEWGDYLPEVWDAWISDRKGKILVATANGKAIGVEHVVMVSGSEAWIEGLRVDPACRRQGIAMKLTKRCIADATDFGAQVVRFITSSLNTPVHRIAANLGFERVSTIQPMAAPPLKTNDVLSIRPDRQYLGSIIDFIQCSPEYEKAAGLYSVGWRFCALTIDEIKKKLKEGAIRLVSDEYDIKALAIVEIQTYGSALAFSFATGETDALRQLALDLRKEAAASNLEEISTRLPALPNIDTAFSRAGYVKSDSNPYWIFEKILVP